MTSREISPLIGGMEVIEQSDGGAIVQLSKVELGILTNSLIVVFQTLGDHQFDSRMECSPIEAQRLLETVSRTYDAQKRF